MKESQGEYGRVTLRFVRLLILPPELLLELLSLALAEKCRHGFQLLYPVLQLSDLHLLANVGFTQADAIHSLRYVELPPRFRANAGINSKVYTIFMKIETCLI